MFDFLLAEQNIPFAVVFALLLAFFVIELLGLLFGGSLGDLLGDFDPGFDFDLNADLDIGFATKFLYWLKIGRIPLLVLLVIFMAMYVICGYGLQLAVVAATGFLMPWWLAAPSALILTVPAVRFAGRHIARIVPRDETEAVNLSDLVGGRAVIVLGVAKKGSAAQGRTVDRFGTTHYLMIEPDDPEAVLEQGRQLLLVRHDGVRFFAIVHPDPDGE